MPAGGLFPLGTVFAKALVLAADVLVPDILGDETVPTVCRIFAASGVGVDGAAFEQYGPGLAGLVVMDARDEQGTAPPHAHGADKGITLADSGVCERPNDAPG